MLARLRDERGARLREPRMRHHGTRLGVVDAGRGERLARKIDTADRSVLVEVTQDVGQLQRSPQVVRQRPPLRRRHFKNPHRKATDRTGDAVTVQVQRGPVRSPDIAFGIHQHAVDDSVEVLLLQTVAPDNRLQGAQTLMDVASEIQVADVLAPASQLGQPFRTRPVAVSDVVDRAAKRVNLVHRLALSRRQDPQCRVERAGAGGGCRG